MNFKTTYQNTNQMSYYILKKYEDTIDHFIDNIKVSPVNYLKDLKLEKNWMIYFFYYKGGKRKIFEARSFIFNGQKIQLNRIKDFDKRVKCLNKLKEAYVNELKNNPRFIISIIYTDDEAKAKYPDIYNVIKKDIITIKDAFKIALEKKLLTVPSSASKKDYTFHCGKFLKYLKKKINNDINDLSRPLILNYLENEILKKGLSEKYYNGTRTHLSNLVDIMVSHELIKDNPIKSIEPLKLHKKPMKNKPFTNELFSSITEELKKEPALYAYFLHIYYGLMRPVTVVRLQVKDVDLERNIFNADTKTGNFIKIIPAPLKEFYLGLDLKSANPEHFIFNHMKFIGEWNVSDGDRRGYYGKKFKKIKDKFTDDSNYTWYSFRHNAICHAFENKAKELKENNVPNYIEKSIDYIRQFTNHTTNDQTKGYLRNMSMLIDEDYSKYLN